MPKIQPILSPCAMQRKDLEFLPRFEGFPKTSVYDAERGRETATPFRDFRLRVMGPEGVVQQVQMEKPAEFLRIASSPDLTSKHVALDTWREMLASVSDFTQSGMGMYTFYGEVMDNTLAYKGNLMNVMELQGLPRIFIGDGFAFHLMGDPKDSDPSARLISAKLFQDEYPDLSEQIDLKGTGADFILGITVWGDRLVSAHARLSLINLFSRLWPMTCPEMADLEVLPAISMPEPNSQFDWIRRIHGMKHTTP